MRAPASTPALSAKERRVALAMDPQRPIKSLAWTTQQLLRLPREVRSGSRTVPVHAWREGTTTHRIALFLGKHRTQWYRLHEIAAATASCPKTASWALTELKRKRIVEACGAGDPALNTRYLRYRLSDARAAAH